MSITSRRIDKCPTPKQRFSDKFPTARTEKMTNFWQMPRGGGRNGHTWNWLCHYHYNLRQIFFLLIGKEPSTWPANNCLQIMAAHAQRRPTVFGFGIWLQIIFCSYIKETTLLELLAWKWQITLLPEDIHGDQMIKQLLNSVIAKYRDLSLSSLCTDPPPLRKNQRSGICESPSLIVYVNNFTRIKNSFRWPKILWLMFHVIPVLKMLVHETYIVFSSSNWERERDF